MVTEHAEDPRTFVQNPPAAESTVLALQAANPGIPPDYLGFLRGGNGGEGFIGRSYVMLWRVEELQRLNIGYEAHRYAPGLLLIGSSGAGDAFAYDKRRKPWRLVRVPFVGMDLCLVDPIADDFPGFLRALRAGG
jgi:hypothetical protein